MVNSAFSDDLFSVYKFGDGLKRPQQRTRTGRNRSALQPYLEVPDFFLFRFQPPFYPWALLVLNWIYQLVFMKVADVLVEFLGQVST